MLRLMGECIYRMKPLEVAELDFNGGKIHIIFKVNKSMFKSTTGNDIFKMLNRKLKIKL